MPPLASARAVSRSSWQTTFTNAPSRTSGRTSRACSMPHATRSGSAPRASVTRSAWRAAAVDHLRAGGGHRDRHLGQVGWQPVQAARRGAAGQPEGRDALDPRRGQLAELHLLAAEVALHQRQVGLEQRHRRGSQAEVGQRRVAAADAEQRSAAGLGVDAGDGRRRHRRVPRERVRDPGAEVDPLGRGRRLRSAPRRCRRPGSGCRPGGGRGSRRPRRAAPCEPPPSAARSPSPTPRPRAGPYGPA